MKYIDYASNYLPGEVYRAGMKEYTPQQRIDYRMAKKYKFKPTDSDGFMHSFEELLHRLLEVRRLILYSYRVVKHRPS